MESKQFGGVSHVRMMPRVSVLLQKLQVFVTDTFVFKILDVFKLQSSREIQVCNIAHKAHFH